MFSSCWKHVDIKTYITKKRKCLAVYLFGFENAAEIS